jgi:hypothetical protein
MCETVDCLWFEMDLMDDIIDLDFEYNYKQDRRLVRLSREYFRLIVVVIVSSMPCLLYIVFILLWFCCSFVCLDRYRTSTGTVSRKSVCRHHRLGVLHCQ